MEKIRLAIIDDHNLFREGILLVLNQIDGIEVVYDTSDGNRFVEALHETEVDVALMAIEMPAIGGALTAPTVSVVPGMGVETIVLAFAVVVIGGLGSMQGAMLGALIVGLVRSAAVHFFPQVELFSIYLVMALVLAVRPRGLFVAAEARKI